MPDDKDPQPQAAEPRTDDDDTEGHAMSARVAGGPEDVMQTRAMSHRIDEDEDDVEGHFGQLRNPSSRGE